MSDLENNKDTRSDMAQELTDEIEALERLAVIRRNALPNIPRDHHLRGSLESEIDTLGKCLPLIRRLHAALVVAEKENERLRGVGLLTSPASIKAGIVEQKVDEFDRYLKYQALVRSKSLAVPTTLAELNLEEASGLLRRLQLDYANLTLSRDEALADLGKMRAMVADPEIINLETTAERYVKYGNENGFGTAHATGLCYQLTKVALPIIRRLQSQLIASQQERAKALEDARQEVLLIDRDEAGECPSGDGWVWYGKSRDHAARRIAALSSQQKAVSK